MRNKIQFSVHFTVPINGNSIYLESLKIEIKRLHVKLILFCAHIHTPTSPNHVQCTQLSKFITCTFFHGKWTFVVCAEMPRHPTTLCSSQQIASPQHFAICEMQQHSGLRRVEKKLKDNRSQIVQWQHYCAALQNTHEPQNKKPFPETKSESRPVSTTPPRNKFKFSITQQKKTWSADQRFSRRLGLYF